MQVRRDLLRAAEGALGGAVGTLALSRGMRAAGRLSERFRPLAPRRGSVAGSLVWVYGMAFPAALGVLAPRLRIDRRGQVIAAGAGLGAAVWAAGSAGRRRFPRRVAPLEPPRPGGLAVSLAGHMAYGVLAAVVTVAADRFFSRRLD
jgi:hypothetical protein